VIDTEGSQAGNHPPGPDNWYCLEGCLLLGHCSRWGTQHFSSPLLGHSLGITIVAFVQEQVVNQLNWLTPQEFLDGLALGQLAPGPVLMLATYVSYKLAGIPGALVGQVAIYIPSFALMLSILPVLARFRPFLRLRA
jgi:hypothetical protein